MPQSPLNLRKMISYSPGGITSKVLVKTQSMNVTLFCMAAGTELSEHTSTKEGLVYVLEGKGTFTLEGKEIRSGRDRLVQGDDKDCKEARSQRKIQDNGYEKTRIS